MIRLPLVCAAGVLALLVGCAAPAIKPAENLDETSGMTVGALQEPLEFVQNWKHAALGNAKRASFAYMGPIEWDRMGDISYSLWIHVAPGNDLQVGSLRAHGAVTLYLDDGPLPLVTVKPPVVGHDPYQPVVSWGQTAYFALDPAMLKRMAASRKLVLEFKLDAKDSKVAFFPSQATGATLTEFARSRGITDD
jgi:hypothetical protein